MKRAVAAIALSLSFWGQASAQENKPWELDEVVVSDIRLTRYAEGHKLTVLSDSTITRSGPFLTSLLAFNSNLYFKENGFGMLSSPSFRGTNASHTAVVWNGINVNSPLTGQVDFNTINPFNYSSVAIRSGGGGVQFGTGAIGGSVHLNNRLRFEKHFDHRTFVGYGSFDTKRINYGQRFGNGKWSHRFGINYVGSDNDYKYLGTDRENGDTNAEQRNLNGEFENVSLNFNAGYRLSDNHQLRLYHQSFSGNRNLSGTFVALGRGRYEDDQFRTQLEYQVDGKKSISTLKLAHLYEGYRFFENKDSDRFSEGRVTTFLARYTHDVELSDALRLNTYLEYDRYSGNGSNFGTAGTEGSDSADPNGSDSADPDGSNVADFIRDSVESAEGSPSGINGSNSTGFNGDESKNPLRNDLSATALLKHKVSEALVYTVGLRKDFSSAFASPLIFSLDGKYAITKLYTLQLNASRNFRMPTFNDLHWNPGGNPDLIPESSYQIDLGQHVALEHCNFSLNGYYIATENMIRWLPDSTGFWSPSNVDAVRIYGLEGELSMDYPIQEKKQVEVKATYAYTVSRDRATSEQLIYVPLHRANGSIAYRFSRFSLNYQQLYNGAVSILGGTLEGYQVANLGVDYTAPLKGKSRYRVGLTLNNVFNTYYENVALRPMPNRNLQTRVIVNF